MKNNLVYGQGQPNDRINETCAVWLATPNHPDFFCSRIVNSQQSIFAQSSPIESLVDFFSRKLLQGERVRLQTTPALQNQQEHKNNKISLHFYL